MIFKNSIKIHQKGEKNYYFHENYLKETNYFRQECIPIGCLPSAAVAFSGRGCLPLGGCLPRVVCLGEVYTPGPRGRHPHPVDRMTDTCESITFPQLLLLTVKIRNKMTKNLCLSSCGSKGGAAPYSPKCSQFHAIFSKIWQNRMLPPLPGGLEPPSYGESWIRPCYI